MSSSSTQDAFDRLSCFEVVAVRASTGEEAGRQTFQVSPGQSSYSLSMQVELESTPESFRVTVTAYASSGGDACGFELFSGTRSISVSAGGLGEDGGGDPTSLALSPSGPHTRASRLELEPGHAVLSGGGTVQLSPILYDSEGSVVADGEDLANTLSWTSSNAAAAEAAPSGRVTGSSSGATKISAETVTGVSATVPVYVADGEFAYVSGGNLIVTTVDGEESRSVASGASSPAWGPEGRLVYASGSGIVGEGGGVLIPGAGSPSFRPTGTHLTGSSGGLIHATADGEFVTEDPVEGPSNARWLNQTHLIGDSPRGLVRVKADGSESTRVTSAPSDRLPSVGDGVYFLSARDGGTSGVFRLEGGGSATRITPDGFTANGRPAVSDGWILVPGSGELGSGLHLVPASGGRPIPLSIPGGTDPAWKTSLPVSSLPGPQITGIEPNRPRGGEEVTLEGTGFDWIVPSANQVEVPILSGGSAATAGASSTRQSNGSREIEVTSASAEALTFEAPPNLAGGDLTVTTPFGQSSLNLDPASGELRLAVRTGEGDPVPGVSVELVNGAGQLVTTRSTGEDGSLLFEDLTVGEYQLTATPSEGYRMSSPSTTATVSLDETTDVDLEASALAWTVEPSTSSITFERIGETRSVTVAVRDIDGRTISAPLTVERIPGSVVTSHVRGSTIDLTSINAGTATVIVSVASESSSSGASSSSPAGAASERSLSAEIAVEVPRPPEPDEPPGSLTGNVYDASTGAGISGATVQVRNTDTGVETSVTTNESGGYEVQDLRPGSYRITVTADGYQSASASATVVSEETTTVSPIGLVTEGAPGDLTGVVRNAIDTSERIAGATVELREGSGAPDSDPVVASTTTNQSGEFSFSEIAAGNYTIRATASGFADGHANVVIQSGTTVSREVLLSPQLAEGEMRIVLTWGPELEEVASDLDSHLTGPHDGLEAANFDYHVDDVDGGRFHIAYYDRGALDALPFAFLHNDDTFYEGPETTTITDVQPGTYRFSVDLFCCTETIRTSQARVQVYDADGLVAEFSPPNQDGETWVVFDIVDGSVVPVNQMDPGRNSSDPEHELAHPGGLNFAPATGFEVAPGVRRDETRHEPAAKTIRPHEFDGNLDRLRRKIETRNIPYVLPSDRSGGGEPEARPMR